jgi:hypothetical protein
LNIKDTKGLNGKMKFILPILFLLLFVSLSSIITFYKKNKARLTN